MVHSEYHPDKNKSLKMSIGAVMKNPKMPRFIPDHLKN